LIYTDPSGHWGTNVHFSATFAWATSFGFSESAAYLIATVDNAVDRGNTSYLPFFGDQSRHFNMNDMAVSGSPGDTRSIHAESCFQDAITAAKNGNLGGALALIGEGLHSLQDIDAHQDTYVHTLFGIKWHWLNSDADNIKVNANGYSDTTRDTASYFSRLIEVLKSLGIDVSSIYSVPNSASTNQIITSTDQTNQSQTQQSGGSASDNFYIPPNCSVYVDGQLLYEWQP